MIGRRLAFLVAGLAFLSTPIEPGSAADLARLPIPQPIADLAFHDADGRMRRLSEYQGRPIILNLWATWCLPCIAELPSLDRLAKELNERGPRVLALSIDRKGMAAVQGFFARNAIRHLEPIVDPSREAVALLNVPILPTTLFLDGLGREIAARHIGPLDWSDPALRASLAALFGTVAPP